VEVSSGIGGAHSREGPIDQVPEIAAARDIPIAVQTLQLKPDPSQAGLYSLEYVAYQTPQNGGTRRGRPTSSCWSTVSW